MSRKRFPFTETITQDAVSSPDDIIYRNDEEGRLVCVQWISFENESGVTTGFRLIIETGSKEVPFLESENTIEDNLYWNDTAFYLKPFDNLICRVTGATAADLLRLYLMGWYQDTAREI